MYIYIHIVTHIIHNHIYDTNMTILDWLMSSSTQKTHSEREGVDFVSLRSAQFFAQMT